MARRSWSAASGVTKDDEDFIRELASVPPAHKTSA